MRSKANHIARGRRVKRFVGVLRYIATRYILPAARRLVPAHLPNGDPAGRDAVRESSRVGGLALVASGLGSFVWIALELVPQGLGYQDTDSPEVALRYLRLHPEVYAQAGTVMLLTAIALTVGVLATADWLQSRVDPLALKTATAAGLLSAALFFMLGVLRLGVRPLLYVDGLDHAWGEAAYLVMQFTGPHGVAQGAVLALSAWCLGLGLIGWRTRALPRLLCLLALFPALRIVTIIGPLGIIAPDADLGILWLVFMLAIPGSLIWVALLGGVLLRGRGASS